MQKTKIEWTDYIWNPIKGICPTGCFYCYARRMYQRFKWNPEMRFELHDPMAIDRLYRKNIPDGSKVFVCSTFELFHPEVPKSWRKVIFDVIKLNPHLTFQILTKFPQNIGRPMPENVWLGVTVTNSGDMLKHWQLRDVKANIKFISMEPLLEDITSQPRIRSCDWIIIGKLTGYGRKYDPEKEWIKKWVRWSRGYDVPIFLKDNLKEIWGEPLIQEFSQ